MFNNICKLVLGMFCGALFSTAVYATTADDLTYMTEEFPPYNYSDANGIATGSGVDVLAEMLMRMGSSKGVKDFKVLPWARAYDLTLNKKNNVLFTMTGTDERAKIFKFVGPIVSSFQAIISLKDNPIEVNSYADLEGAKIAVVKNDICKQLLEDANVNKRNFVELSGKDVLVQATKMLNAKKIDFISYEYNVFIAQLKANGGDPAKYKPAFTLKIGEMFIAFNNETPDDLIAQFQSTLDEIKADGTYKKILAKYSK